MNEQWRQQFNDLLGLNRFLADDEQDAIRDMAGALVVALVENAPAWLDAVRSRRRKEWWR